MPAVTSLVHLKKIVGANVRLEDLQRLKKQMDFLVESFSDEEPPEA